MNAIADKLAIALRKVLNAHRVCPQKRGRNRRAAEAALAEFEAIKPGVSSAAGDSFAKLLADMRAPNGMASQGDCDAWADRIEALSSGSSLSRMRNDPRPIPVTLQWEGNAASGLLDRETIERLAAVVRS